MIAIAKTHAAYGLLDTPCRPSRSAYVDGRGGDDLFTQAEHRWWRYRSALLSNSDADLLELRPDDWEVLRICPICHLADDAHKIGCPRRDDTPPPVDSCPSVFMEGRPVIQVRTADGWLNVYAGHPS